MRLAAQVRGSLHPSLPAHPRYPTPPPPPPAAPRPPCLMVAPSVNTHTHTPGGASRGCAAPSCVALSSTAPLSPRCPYLPLTTCCLPLTTCCLPSYYLLLASYYLLLAACDLLLITDYLLLLTVLPSAPPAARRRAWVASPSSPRGTRCSPYLLPTTYLLTTDFVTSGDHVLPLLATYLLPTYLLLTTYYLPPATCHLPLTTYF